MQVSMGVPPDWAPCPRCGNFNGNENRFCTTCGWVLPDTQHFLMTKETRRWEQRTRPGFPNPTPRTQFNSSGILSETMRIFRRHFAGLFVSYVVFGAVIKGIESLLGQWLLGRPDLSLSFLPTAVADGGTTDVVTFVVAALIFSVITALVGAALTGGVANFVTQRQRGVSIVLRSSIATGIRRVPSLFGASVAAVVVPTVLFVVPFATFSVATARGDAFLLAISFVSLLLTLSVGIYILVAFSLYAPALMLENLNAVGSLRRSLALTKGSRGIILGVIILLGVVQAGISLALSVPAVLSGSVLVESLLRVIAGGITGSWVVIAVSVVYNQTVGSSRVATANLE